MPARRMTHSEDQLSLFDDLPLAAPDPKEASRALDELFHLAGQYRTGKAYRELLQFIQRFHFYAPYNAMLLHVQMPGAEYVATAGRWMQEYRRRVKPEARPLVILRTMGPVMFVFDVSDTEPIEGAPPLPLEVENPFGVRAGGVGGELLKTTENAGRDGVLIRERDAGSQDAGVIGSAETGRYLDILASRSTCG